MVSFIQLKILPSSFFHFNLGKLCATISGILQPSVIVCYDILFSLHLNFMNMLDIQIHIDARTTGRLVVKDQQTPEESSQILLANRR